MGGGAGAKAAVQITKEAAKGTAMGLVLAVVWQVTVRSDSQSAIKSYYSTYAKK